MVCAVSSGSAGSITLASMLRSMSSPWPLTVARTRPPLAVPVTSASASACWASMSCCCICCAAANSCCISIWGSTSASYAEPTTTPNQPSPVEPDGSVFDIADHLAAQLTLDQVHPGKYRYAGSVIIRRLVRVLRRHLVIGRRLVVIARGAGLGGRSGAARAIPARFRTLTGRPGGSGRAGIQVCADYPLDHDIEAESRAQDPLENGVVAAHAEALHFPFPEELQGQDPALKGKDARVAEQRPRHPALLLDRVQDRIPVLAQ